jgi:hypothetical protein
MTSGVSFIERISIVTGGIWLRSVTVTLIIAFWQMTATSTSSILSHTSI